MSHPMSAADADTLREIVVSILTRDASRLHQLVGNVVREPGLLWRYIDSLGQRFCAPPADSMASADVMTFPDGSGFAVDVPLWIEGEGKPSHFVVRLDVLTESDPHQFIFRTVLEPEWPEVGQRELPELDPIHTSLRAPSRRRRMPALG